MEKLLAAASGKATPLGTIGGEGLGPFAKSTGNPVQTITTAISGFIGALTVIAAIWFLVQFLIGGISWISSAGDKAKITESRERLTNAFIGLLVVVAGWAILAIAGQFFGWSDILAPASLFEKIKFK
jgi:hypothetical protein